MQPSVVAQGCILALHYSCDVCALLLPILFRKYGIFYVSRLMLRPNRAYSSIFSCCISSFVDPILSSNSETSSSTRVVEEASMFCAWDKDT